MEFFLKKYLKYYFQISYGISRPQLNFIRILSDHVWQEVILHCTQPVGRRGNVEIVLILLGLLKRFFPTFPYPWSIFLPQNWTICESVMKMLKNVLWLPLIKHVIPDCDMIGVSEGKNFECMADFLSHWKFDK